MTTTTHTNVPPRLLDEHDWRVYLEGYRAGIDRGRELEREDLATFQREAMRVVHGLANRPARDAVRDAEIAAERERRWSR